MAAFSVAHSALFLRRSLFVRSRTLAFSEHISFFSSTSSVPLFSNKSKGHARKKSKQPVVSMVELGGVKVSRDEVVRDDPTNNVPDSIFSKLGMQLHRRDHHPIGIIKNGIFDYFDSSYPNKFAKFDNLCPIVPVKTNFDDVLVPADRVSRSYNDTYYVDSQTVLRCHASAHQAVLLRKSKFTHLPNFIAPNGGQITSRGRGIQGKQVSGGYVPVYFLLNSFSYSRFYRAHCQIPFILPHPSSLSPFQKILPLVSLHYSVVCIKPQVFLCYLSKSRSFCKYVDSSDGVVDNAKFEAEVERVCKLIDETFSLDRNMEVILDECVIDLNHDLVLGVLRRFKHARKPAFRFFSWATEIPGFAHDSKTYNAMMDILGKNGQFETMISILEEMGEKGLLSLETFSICIKTFAAAKERRKAVGVFDLMKKYKFKISAETMSCLLDALGRAKLGKEARALFERFKHKFTPDITTYTVLLNGCCEARDLLGAGRVWNEMIDSGWKPDIVAHMLEGLLRGGKRSDYIKLFEVMKFRGPFPNVRSYTILINHFCKQGNMEEAMTYLNDMFDSGVEPDAAVYTCLMIGFGNQMNMYMVHLLLKQMKEKGCSPDGLTYNALIKMMVNRKMPDDAVKVYKKMIQSKIEPSIHTYNMIMKAYFVTRNYEMGCAAWEEMKRKGLCPDENSYIVFIGGLVRQRKMNEALKYLKEMNDKGMKAPDFSKVDGSNTLETFAREKKFSGNFEVADLFARCLRR